MRSNSWSFAQALGQTRVKIPGALSGRCRSQFGSNRGRCCSLSPPSPLPLPHCHLLQVLTNCCLQSTANPYFWGNFSCNQFPGLAAARRSTSWRRERCPTPWLPPRRGAERLRTERERHWDWHWRQMPPTYEVVCSEIERGRRDKGQIEAWSCEQTFINSWEIRTDVEKVKWSKRKINIQGNTATYKYWVLLKTSSVQNGTDSWKSLQRPSNICNL